MEPLNVAAIIVRFVKAPRPYLLAEEHLEDIAGTSLVRVGGYSHLDSRHCEATLVEIRTTDGLSGWGECQSPIAPAVVGTIIQQVLGPLLLGRDALMGTVLATEMYEALRVRGQTSGHQIDALAGLDTALWDLRGRHFGLSIARLAGGPYRTELPAYVSGLRKDRRPDEAAIWATRGFGVKIGLRGTSSTDIAEVADVRTAIGEESTLFIDGMWKCSSADVVHIARQLEECGVDFFESPLDPEDVSGHARLARRVDLPIAVGEPLRTRYQFLPWFVEQALSVAQPDLMRIGPTEALTISSLAQAFHTPVAFHCGMATPIGMAATWQVAASIPNFLVQEFQPAMVETFGALVANQLQYQGGKLVVPEGAGLGVDIDHQALESMTEGMIEIHA